MGVPYTLYPVFPHIPEVDAIHPASQVPCLRHDDVTPFESKAIANYIECEFSGSKFIPEDKLEAAQVEIEDYIAPVGRDVADTGYLVGGKLTYVEMKVLPVLAALTMFPATNDKLSKHKNLSAYASELSERSTFKNTAPPEN